MPCQIFELHELTKDDIVKGLKKALEDFKDIKINEETLDYIATLSSGDMRFALNLLEVAYYSVTKKLILK